MVVLRQMHGAEACVRHFACMIRIVYAMPFGITCLQAAVHIRPTTLICLRPQTVLTNIACDHTHEACYCADI